MRWKLFFFDQIEWDINKSIFFYWCQKCTYTYDLSKKCIQIKFCPKNRFFRTSFNLFKKSFHLLEGTMSLLKNLKGQKWKKPLFRKTIFYKQILDFHCHSKILCHTSKLWNFVKITGVKSLVFYMYQIWKSLFWLDSVTMRKRWVKSAFDRSPFKLFTLKFSNKSVQAPSCDRPIATQRNLFLSFANNNCFPITV